MEILINFGHILIARTTRPPSSQYGLFGPCWKAFPTFFLWHESFKHHGPPKRKEHWPSGDKP